MNINRAIKSFVLSYFLCCLNQAKGEESPLVVMHPGTQITPALGQTTLRAIFGMHLRSWEDGTPIKVFVLPSESPVHSTFCKKILNVYPHQLQSSWDRLVFSGTGQAPVEVESEEQMHRKIASTPGAIGYLNRTLVDGAVQTISPR